MKNKKRFIPIIMLFLGVILFIVGYEMNYEDNNQTLFVDLDELTVNDDNIKEYTRGSYNEFLTDFKNNKLNNIYITDFLFDGVGQYKALDLDDFIKGGNEMETSSLNIKTINITKGGNYQLKGSLTGMLAINTNNLQSDVNIYLNNVVINSDSKKVPAIYVYNKDINYTKYKVSIISNENTENYIEGGKLKKVSMMPSDKLVEYENKYDNEVLTNYQKLTNYYGIYKESEIDNILFAKIEADTEDLEDGDPYYFYKGAGVISSDIDLYFKGTGSLEVVSKNNEGIETKGNLTLGNGTGDYKISAYDDCLNTTTSSLVLNARNTMTINVKTLKAIVNEDAKEGDAIDSNGEIIINGGQILAVAKSGSDSGLDSDSGTFINSGVVLATGDMYDEINSNSKQNFMVLEMNGNFPKDSLIVLLDKNEKIVFSYKTARTYSYLVFSSDLLQNGTYYLYKDGTLKDDGSYEKGVLLGYTNNNINNMESPPHPIEGNIPPEQPENNLTIPKLDNNKLEKNKGSIIDNTASNKEFTINNVKNFFNGVAIYKES